MRELYNIGSTGFAQVGQNDYWEKQKFEGDYLKMRVMKEIGEPPAGSWLKWKGFPHDFGTYHELCLSVEDGNKKHEQYFSKAEMLDFDAWEDDIRVAYDELLAKQDPEKIIQELDSEQQFHEFINGADGMDSENMHNLGPTGHGPDICASDCDPGL